MYRDLRFFLLSHADLVLRSGHTGDTNKQITTYLILEHSFHLNSRFLHSIQLNAPMPSHLILVIIFHLSRICEAH